MRKKKKIVSKQELMFIKERKQFLNNRRLRFSELLGEECGYIDSLTEAFYVSPWDIQALLDKGCPKELAPKILL